MSPTIPGQDSMTKLEDEIDERTKQVKEARKALKEARQEAKLAGAGGGAKEGPAKKGKAAAPGGGVSDAQVPHLFRNVNFPNLTAIVRPSFIRDL